MRKIFKSSLFICLAIILSSAFLFAYNPPNYLHTFYGDATGDMLLQVDDIPTHKQYAASGAASYNTTQPQTSSQYWNTCDMTGDNLCQVDDIPSLKQVAAGNTISVSLTSWHIDNWNLPSSGNASGSFIPFQLNVQATGGAVVGRPGIIMKVTIDPIGSTTTGLLQGRSCSSGDLHESGATCAIAVSVTDMADPNNSVGLTESASSTTLAVKADGYGTLHLHLETIAQPFLNIPAMTLDLYPTFSCGGCGLSIDCSNPGPNPVIELSAMQCTVTDNGGGSPVKDTGVDTCGGSIAGTGPWTYDFTPTEAQGPGTCIAAVMDSGNNAMKSNGNIHVNEVNQAPVDNAPASSDWNELTAVSFVVNPTDVDIPAQTLTCFQVSNSCPGGALAGCVWSGWTPTEVQGPTSCDVVTRAYDGVAYSSNVTTHIKVNEVNTPPINNVPPGVSVGENGTYAFSTNPTDPDIPAQTLTSSVVSATGYCSNGTFSGNTWSWRITEAQAPSTCSFVSRVSDGIANSSDVRTLVMANEINQNPAWLTAPADVTITGGSTYNQVNGLVTDADLPNVAVGNPGYISSCSASDNCSAFNVTASCSAGTPPQNVSISFSPPTTASVYSCGANINVYDSMTPAGLSTRRMTIYVYPSSSPHISGTIQFQKAPISSSGLNLTGLVNRPAKRVLTQMVRVSDSAVVGTDYTDDTGAYDVRGPASTTVYIRIVALMDDGYLQVFVVPPGSSSVYAAAGGNIALGTSNMVASYAIPDSTRASGPFNILDVILQSYVLVHTANPTSVLPALEVDWSSSNSTQGAWYNPSEVAIYLLGDRNVDSDEFDDHVIAHEFGHFVAHNLYRDDSIGGSHTLTDKLDVRVAYSEGFGNGFCGMGLNDPYYWDSYGPSAGYAWGFNLENNAQYTTNAGYANEASIYAILWDLFDTPSDNNDSLAFGYGPLNSVWRNSGYLNNSDYAYLYPFASKLIELQPASSVAIKANLTDESVTYPESAGLTFTDVTLNYSANNVAINGTNGSNKYVANKYYRFTLSSTSNVRVTTTCAININIYVQRKGTYVGWVETSSGNETLSMNALPAGTYVVDITAIQAASSTFNITIGTF